MRQARELSDIGLGYMVSTRSTNYTVCSSVAECKAGGAIFNLTDRNETRVTTKIFRDVIGFHVAQVHLKLVLYQK